MSFQLGIWFSEKPLSLSGAGELFDQMAEGKTAGLRANAGVKAFFNQLVRRYPSLDNWPSENLDECPWADPPEYRPTHVMLSLLDEFVEPLEAVVVDLALDNGLLVYDPQTPDLHLPPALENETFWRLEAGDTETLDPDAGAIQAALRALTTAEDSYVVLSRSATAFMQAVLDTGSEYILEVQDGGGADLFQAVTQDRAVAERAFAAFRAGDEAGWKNALDWTPVD